MREIQRERNRTIRDPTSETDIGGDIDYGSEPICSAINLGIASVLTSKSLPLYGGDRVCCIRMPTTIRTGHKKNNKKSVWRQAKIHFFAARREIA